MLSTRQELIKATALKYMLANGAAPVCEGHVTGLMFAIDTALDELLSDPDTVTGFIRISEEGRHLEINTRVIAGRLAIAGGILDLTVADQPVEVSFRFTPVIAPPVDPPPPPITL